jgi:hypothetical protein
LTDHEVFVREALAEAALDLIADHDRRRLAYITGSAEEPEQLSR